MVGTQDPRPPPGPPAPPRAQGPLTRTLAGISRTPTSPGPQLFQGLSPSPGTPLGSVTPPAPPVLRDPSRTSQGSGTPQGSQPCPSLPVPLPSRTPGLTPPPWPPPPVAHLPFLLAKPHWLPSPSGVGPHGQAANQWGSRWAPSPHRAPVLTTCPSPAAPSWPPWPPGAAWPHALCTPGCVLVPMSSPPTPHALTPHALDPHTPRPHTPRPRPPRPMPSRLTPSHPTPSHPPRPRALPVPPGSHPGARCPPALTRQPGQPRSSRPRAPVTD